MLRPVHADLYFDYKCPSCSSILQVSLKEVKEIGKVLCGCNKVLVFEPFKANLQLDYITKDKPVVPKAVEKPKVNTVYKNVGRSQVEVTLCNLGWSKGEAKRIVLAEDDGKMDDDVLLQKCLKKQTV
jgi:hypothetical protein